jgi:glutamyl-tRNA synthetase
MTARVRFSPGGSGPLDVGDARAALYSWLYARHEGGALVLRLQDEGPTVAHAGGAEAVCDTLRWLGLDWDEGPHTQSRPASSYYACVERLVERGRAYRCYCAVQDPAHDLPRCDGRCRDLAPVGVSPAIRFLPPRAGQVVFDDLVYRTQVVENSVLEDVILLKPDGSPTRLLASVVYDHAMAVTHVIRGYERLADTSVHLHLCAALGWDPPLYAHLPPIVWPEDKSPMWLTTYRERGYLALAMANQLARLGWSPRGRRELLSLQELVERFDLRRVSHSQSMFDVRQLDWFNQRCLAQLDEATLARLFVPRWQEAYGLAHHAEGTALTPGEWQRTLAVAVRTEVHVLSEVAAKVRFAFADGVEPGAEAAEMLAQPYASEVLLAFVAGIAAVEPFAFGPIDALVSDLRRRFKVSHGIRSRDVMYVIRAALTGQLGGACLVVACQLLGRRRCVERTRVALEAHQHA